MTRAKKQGSWVMSNIENRGRNKEVLVERPRMQADASSPVTEAEFYLVLGRILRLKQRQGFRLVDCARRFDLPVSDCVAAVCFAESSRGLKLRALVEKWS